MRWGEQITPEFYESSKGSRQILDLHHSGVNSHVQTMELQENATIPIGKHSAETKHPI